jgi:hypothetical protein
MSESPAVLDAIGTHHNTKGTNHRTKGLELPTHHTHEGSKLATARKETRQATSE